jgi:hypothetical protein
MLDDGVKDKGKEEEFNVKDIAEIVGKIRGQAGKKVKKEDSRPVACSEFQNIKEVMMMYYNGTPP